VVSEHVGAQLAVGEVDWDIALAAYNAVRPEDPVESAAECDGSSSNPLSIKSEASASDSDWPHWATTREKG
jgi:hypothetical protein